MHRIIAKKVMMDLTSRLPSMVQISMFDRSGREMETRLLPGRLFPDDIKDGDAIVFIQEEKLAKLGEAID